MLKKYNRLTEEGGIVAVIHDGKLSHSVRYTMYLHVHFPQFVIDRLYLMEHNILNFVELSPTEYFYKWNLSLTSLAEYFNDFKLNDNYYEPVISGFWSPIESSFRIDRGKLRHLASKNGRKMVKTSRDYEYLMSLLEPFRLDPKKYLSELFIRRSRYGLIPRGLPRL